MYQPSEVYERRFQTRYSIEAWFGLDPEWVLTDAEFIPGKGVQYLFHRRITNADVRDVQPEGRR